MASTPRSAIGPERWSAALVNNGQLAAGLGVLALLAWSYLLYQSWAMGRMASGMAMPDAAAWNARELFAVFVMWTVMMIGMMTPSAAPMLLFYAQRRRLRGGPGQPGLDSLMFLIGYLLVWTAFSLLATLLQWGLHNHMLISPMMVGTNPLLGGFLLICAGIYQWTPAKQACLARCRSPIAFLLTEWRNGPRGALIMGIRHGGFCTGCCWLLMLVLFVVGVMNLAWIALLTAWVLLEKSIPQHLWPTRLAGLAMIVWGGWLAFA